MVVVVETLLSCCRCCHCRRRVCFFVTASLCWMWCWLVGCGVMVVLVIVVVRVVLLVLVVVLVVVDVTFVELILSFSSTNIVGHGRSKTYRLL
jgi:hypothetical protein